MTVPLELFTARLRLRPWHAEDAAALHPVLDANREHLGPWIPARVADPVTVPLLAQRLEGFAADFTANREWRYGVFALDGLGVLGEVALFPRSATERVPFVDSDRAELGYWLRADETGRGLVAEAARAVLAVAAAVPRFSHVEIRCDARNAPSVAVAVRLGFVLMESYMEPAEPDGELSHMQLWKSVLQRGLPR